MRFWTKGSRPFLFSALFLLSGCAIAPVTDDVAHVSASNIARQIRCEARQAVIDALLGYLTSVDNNMNKKKLDDYSFAIGNELRRAYNENPEAIRAFDPSQVTGFAHTVTKLLYSTGIAYYYDLTGLETNNIDPAANLIRPTPITSLVTLGLSGSFDRQRQNEWSFTITDNFGNLVQKTSGSYCANHLVRTEDYVYPIAGKVGLAKLIKEFTLMSLFENLDELNKDVATVKKGPPSMVQQLQFTTALGGGASPKIVFAPSGPQLQVTDVSFPVTVSRKDTHQLTVGLYLDKGEAKVLDAARGPIYEGSLITASGGRAEQGAARAVQQFLALKIFKPAL
ncbi:hypothetical protein QA639_34550 [Bradyrhizobium pachyrhizi]|uniref:hypothetical protein n=1 Tax=Bradyrhizobium pachyrhizi TaxID=280333 RepID=UPI0024B0BC6E|nr:hypothetical protein [Bradyrhizobium pachyrhizi]WFU54667.1 hypothetical protein QA639_34550 [Bradyrhizobium pachyrhizi]